jgi:hypothetical protein
MEENQMGCCSYGTVNVYGARSFLTKAEKIEMLKEYQKELDNEAIGVAQRIKELEKHEDA